MFEIKVVEKIKTHFMFNIPLPPPPRKSCRLKDNVEKCGGEKQAAGGNMAARYMLDNKGYTRASTHPHTHTHTHTHAHTHRNM
jgi:hypothetical protein